MGTSRTCVHWIAAYFATSLTMRIDEMRVLEHFPARLGAGVAERRLHRQRRRRRARARGLRSRATVEETVAPFRRGVADAKETRHHLQADELLVGNVLDGEGHGRDELVLAVDEARVVPAGGDDVDLQGLLEIDRRARRSPTPAGRTSGTGPGRGRERASALF